MNLLAELAVGVTHRIQARRDIRGRHPPRLRVCSPDRLGSEGALGARPTVYYLCPDNDQPSGGVRIIYRHVDVLNSAGLPAYVVHHRRGFACSWFKHHTPVVGASVVTLTPRDILVIPEFYGPALHELPVGPRLLIFNMRPDQTFYGVRAAPPGAPYRNIPGIEAILVLSHHSAEYVRYAFPELRVERIRPMVNGEIFYPSAIPPGRRVAVMPRRRAAADWAQLRHLLRARGCLDSWEVIDIDGCSEHDTAEAFRSCAIFLSFSTREGFGMPAAEAMACGCYVIGFTGFGGGEFFDPADCSPIAEGNLLAFAKAAERELLANRQEMQAMRSRALAASARILDEYSPERQRVELLAVFNSLLGRSEWEIDSLAAATPLR